MANHVGDHLHDTPERQLVELRGRALAVKLELEELLATELATFRPQLQQQISALQRVLDVAPVPKRFQVAVVGRFKVGKSSFVNDLTGRRLVGVHDKPETAAISILQNSTSYFAEVHFVSLEEWNAAKTEHSRAIASGAAQRVASFLEHAQRLGKNEAELAADWIRSGGHIHRVDAPNPKALRDTVTEFTSAKKALHFFVKHIVIGAPIDFLGASIHLIDTPGLDDTERFRVRLTEEFVAGVDAILLLTSTGAAYGQSDKDFLLRQLRMGKLRHLQVVATKADVTYAGAVRDALADERPEPDYEAFVLEEKARIKSELDRTLDELLDARDIPDDVKYYLIEQFGTIQIHVVATGTSASQPQQAALAAVRHELIRSLGTSEVISRAIDETFTALVELKRELQRGVQERSAAIEGDPVLGNVSSELLSFRASINARIQSFIETLAELLGELERLRLESDDRREDDLTRLELDARKLLDQCRAVDLGLNWQRKRFNHWGGDVVGLTRKIADSVFITQQRMLGQSIAAYHDFMQRVGRAVPGLETDLAERERTILLTPFEPLGLAREVGANFEGLVSKANKKMDAYRTDFARKLEDYASPTVRASFDAARETVSGICGKGTTVRQNEAIEQFYTEVWELLRTALREHAGAQRDELWGHALAEARDVGPRIQARVLETVKARARAVESARLLRGELERNEVRRHLDRLRAIAELI